MKAFREPLVRLLMFGAGPRLAIGLAIILLLWAGFFWATSTVEA